MSKQNPIVLIVEDEELLLEAINKKLSLNGVTAIACNSGEKALTMLKDAKEIPDAIWLDYHLKDMDGIAFMTKLKEEPKWEHIPVIVVSNSAGPDNIHSMMTLGAKEYLVKAASRLEDITTRIKELIVNQP